MGFPISQSYQKKKKLPKQQQQHWFFPMGVWELMSFSSKLHCLCTKCISGLPINVWSKIILVSLFLLKPNKHLSQRQSHPGNVSVNPMKCKVQGQTGEQSWFNQGYGETRTFSWPCFFFTSYLKQGWRFHTDQLLLSSSGCWCKISCLL